MISVGAAIVSLFNAFFISVLICYFFLVFWSFSKGEYRRYLTGGERSQVVLKNDTFENLANRNWESIRETNSLKKRKKFCDYMLRRGFESNLVYEKLKELETSEK